MNSTSFNLVGAEYFSGTDISFQVSLINGTTAADVLAYEWYFDDVLMVDEIINQFASKVPIGGHKIGVRLLGLAGWTGIKSLSFVAGKVPTILQIAGPDHLEEGEHVSYYVQQVFSDGSTEDRTSGYVFSNTAGGSFSGNVFTAGINDPSHHTITISAQKGASAPITKQITIGNTIPQPGILVIHLYNDNSLNVIGLIDNSGVTGNHIAAYTGYNTVLSGSAPAQALILASDLNNDPPTNWKFEFNIAKLVAIYPAIQDFVFYLKGRSVVTGTLEGAYSVQSDAGVMTLNNSAGNYMPSVIGGTEIISLTNFSTYKVSGANGSYSESALATLMRFNYNVPTKTLTYTNQQPPILVNDFDFMAVRYHWLTGSGSDLDTITGFENNGTAYDNAYVGYGQPNHTVPANTVPQANAFLWWGADNTGGTGYECILIGIKAFINAYPASPNIVEVGLYVVWFGIPVTGDFTVELVTYKGGTMSLSGTDFVNTGGVQVSSDTISLNTMIHNSAHTPASAYKVGTLKYNKTTQSATIDID